MRLLLIAVLALGCQSVDYTKPVTVDELVDHADDRVGHDAVVIGFVQPSSIESKVIDQRSQQTFRLIKGGKEVRARHTGPMPDSFGDDAEVTIRGKVVRESGALVIVCDGDCLTAKRHF